MGQKTVRSFIYKIGEPMIKQSLLELYYRAFLDDNKAIQDEIEKLKLKLK